MTGRSNHELLAAERTALGDDFERFGPDVPTLCAGWTAFDLVAHMVVREHEPLAASGIVLPGPFAAHMARRMEAAKRNDGFARLVERLRAGPGPLFRLAGPAANLNEYFVHHEDLRRANGEGPRSMPSEYENFLWRALAFTALLAKPKVREFGLRLVATDGRVRVVRAAEPMVELSGEPSEIMLYMAGRKEVADVRITGPDSARAALAAAALRL